MKAGLRKTAKKARPGMTKNFYDNVVGFEWLNYGPNEALGSVIKPGYALVNLKANK